MPFVLAKGVHQTARSVLLRTAVSYVCPLRIDLDYRGPVRSIMPFMAGIVHASLMCHAPIVLPEIAGPRAAQVSRSTDAMAEAASRLIGSNPDTIVLVSPHTPRHRHAFGLLDGYRQGGSAKTLQGSFGDFGFDMVKIKVGWDENAHNLILKTATGLDIAIEELPPLPLDHGAMVPLHFIQRAAAKANWTGGVVLVSLPYSATSAQCRQLGETIAKAAALSSQRWAFLASGDMSHRLTRDAPNGYHPSGPRFDSEFVRLVTQGDYYGATKIDPRLRDSAAEDVVNSFEIAAAAVGFAPQNHEVLSYEGPFGVGYLIATLYRE